MTEELIFELSIRNANNNGTLRQLKQDLKDINDELKRTDAGTDAFVKLTQEATETTFLIEELTKAQKLMKKEFAETQLPTDSLAALRLEYSRLVVQISYLSDVERESELGKATITQAKNLKDRINEIEQSFGNFTGSVGNYKEGILSAAQALGQFGGTLGEQSQILQQAVTIFEFGGQALNKFYDVARSGAETLKQNIASFREYITSLKQTKKTSDEAAAAQKAVSDASEDAGEAATETGKGLAESAKGATLAARAGTVLKTVLAGLGIGLVIAFITGLIGVFRRFAPVVDFVEQVVAGLSAALDVLISRVALVVSAFSKLLDGDFSGAFDDITGSVSGIGSAMVSAGIAAAGLTKEFQDLQDAQADYELQAAKTETQIAKLDVRLRDSTKSASSRLATARELTKLETENLKEKTALIDREIDIEKRRLLLTGQVSKEQADQIAAGNLKLARQLEDEFKLEADQASRLRELLIDRQNLETDSVNLLERTKNRSNKIREQEGERLRRLAEKEAREIEAQIARINELRKSIRDFDASTIINDFDRQSVEIENKRADALAKVGEARDKLTKKIADQKGVLTEADKLELNLISEQTASIIAAYDLQSNAVEKNREKALAKQQQELAQLSVELTELAEQNAERLAQAEAEILNSDFAVQRAELLAVLEERKRALTEQLADGTISQKKFKEEYIRAQEAFNIGTLALERKRAVDVKRVLDDLRDARIEAARAELAVRLAVIDAESDAELERIKERALAEGGDATAALEAERRARLERRASAEIEFNDKVRAANDANTQAQINSAQAINEANDKVHQDELKRLEIQRQKRKELRDAILDTSKEIAGAIFEIDRNRADAQLKSQTEALDKEFVRRRELAQGNTAELETLDKEYAKRKEAIELQAARKRKQTAVTEAIIQGSLAVVKALPNLILAAVTAVATAAQIAVINSQSFAKGGIAQFRKSGRFAGRPHSAGGVNGYFDDGTRVNVEEDEIFVILNKRASRHIGELSAHNHKYGGRRFDTGGSLDFTPQFSAPGESGGGQIIVIQSGFTDEQVQYFSDEVSNKTASRTSVAVVTGLDDKNRTDERQQIMEANREV